MAPYDLVRLAMKAPSEILDVPEWRTRDFGLGFQTFEIGADGMIRLRRLERRLLEDHPPRPGLFQAGYDAWLERWTVVETSEILMTGFTGRLHLEGRDIRGNEWIVEGEVEAGRCKALRVKGDQAEGCLAAA